MKTQSHWLEFVGFMLRLALTPFAFFGVFVMAGLMAGFQCGLETVAILWRPGKIL